MHGMERPLQNRPVLLAVGFVEAARFLGGQLFGCSATKLIRSVNNQLPPSMRRINSG
jgi:hypothetical protein